MSLELLLWTRETTLAFHKNWKQTPLSKFMFLWMVSYYLSFSQINCVKKIWNPTSKNNTLFKHTVTFYKILNPKLFKTHVYNTSYHLHYLYTIQKSIQPWSIFHLLSTLIQKNNPESIFFTFFVIIHCDEWAASHSSLSIVCLICISSEIYHW